MKFKYKITIILCCILIGTTGIISGIWYRYSKEMIIDNAFEAMNILLKERDGKLADTIENIDNQIRTLAYNNTVVDSYFHNKWENEYLNEQASKKMESLLTNVYIGNPEITSIEVGNYEGEYMVRGLKLEEEFWQDKQIMKTIELADSKYILLSYGGEEYLPEKIIFFRQLMYYGDNIGYCAVTLQSSLFQEALKEAFMDNAVIMVQTKEGFPIYVSGRLEAYAKNIRLIDVMDQQTNSTKETIKDDAGVEWVMVGNSETSPFKMRVAVPVKDLLGNLFVRFLNVIIITIFMLGLMLGVIYILTRWIGRNIDSLTEAIQTFGKGRMDTEIELSGKDEFAKVSEAFNIMTQDIKLLTEDIKEKEKEKMTLEIRALQGQINLHFLFNTLNTIKNLCYIQRVTNVERLVDSFMKLLHISMEQDTEFVSLKT